MSSGEQVADRARLGAGDRAVLFAFDDHAMPWRYRVRLRMHRPEKHAGNPILARGPAGAVDSRRMQCCPVVHDGERFRMWYIARDDGSSGRGGDGRGRAAGRYSDVDPAVVHSYDTGRICYAESDDGLTWTRPELGLVEYGGSRRNNIVDLPPGTSDSPLTVMQTLPMDGFVVVSTPQDLAIIDAKRCINMIRKLNLNVVGIVENYAGDIFGEGAGRQLAEDIDAPFLGSMSLNSSYRDTSRPTVLVDETVSGEYASVADELRRSLKAHGREA